MAAAPSLSEYSDVSSIFGMENDGRCIVLREKCQGVRALFEKWAPKYARYQVYTKEEIDASDDINEAVTDLDTERGQICLAIIDLALTATKSFDVDVAVDCQMLKNVALNCVRKKMQMDALPPGDK